MTRKGDAVLFAVTRQAAIIVAKPGGCRVIQRLFISTFGVLLLLGHSAPAVPPEEDVGRLSRDVLQGTQREMGEALDALLKRGGRDVIPALVLAARYRPRQDEIFRALSDLTGSRITSWKEAMLWQEAHPEVTPHESFRELKLDVLHQIDPRFNNFLGAQRAYPENMKIRLEEIAWGGVPVDGIPSLDNPRLIAAGEADYLEDDDLVFGVEINGDGRAYPLRIMGWHEMFNETIGGVPVALAYCTLCGAGILFETHVEGRERPFIFGSSGLLYRSNKLMFDRETDSLWNQFTGRPVSGPLVDSGIALKMRPVVITSWAEWRKSQPETKVLSLETGFNRDYRSGVVYQDYFASPDLMFPTIVRREDVLKRKDYVFGIRHVAAAKAWPLEAFRDRSVINDAVGDLNVVLIGDASTRSVRAYERGERQFTATVNPDRLNGPGGDWTITEEFLLGPDGTRLARVAGHISYWFAWDGYLGFDSELYSVETPSADP
jgi:hypothetical protein